MAVREMPKLVEMEVVVEVLEEMPMFMVALVHKAEMVVTQEVMVALLLLGVEEEQDKTVRMDNMHLAKIMLVMVEMDYKMQYLVAIFIMQVVAVDVLNMEIQEVLVEEELALMRAMGVELLELMDLVEEEVLVKM